MCPHNLCFSRIGRKAMIRNRYNYPTPPIRDIKGKETQTRNNWTLMETSLAESQTDRVMKDIRTFLSENFHFLVVKFSIYTERKKKRRVEFLPSYFNHFLRCLL